MMLRGLLLIALVAIFSVPEATAFVCPSDYCDSVTCEKTGTAFLKCLSQGKVLIPKSGTCGCCSDCVRLLTVGESCTAEFILGPSDLKEFCLPGLSCTNGVCARRTQ